MDVWLPQPLAPPFLEVKPLAKDLQRNALIPMWQEQPQLVLIDNVLMIPRQRLIQPAIHIYLDVEPRVQDVLNQLNYVVTTLELKLNVIILWETMGQIDVGMLLQLAQLVVSIRHAPI